MSQLLLVALGGALGAAARYLVAGWVQDAVGGIFPWGTVAVNLLGSFLLGFVLQASLAGSVSTEYRLLLAVGFLGAFTTFSTFAYEALELMRASLGPQALLYVGVNLIAGLLLVALGMAGFDAWRG